MPDRVDASPVLPFEYNSLVLELNRVLRAHAQRLNAIWNATTLLVDTDLPDWTSASAAFVNLGGLAHTDYTKQDGTDLIVQASWSMDVSGIGPVEIERVLKVGANLSPARVTIVERYIHLVQSHVFVGLPAGTYAIGVQVRKTDGGGSSMETTDEFNDLQITVTEQQRFNP